MRVPMGFCAGVRWWSCRRAYESVRHESFRCICCRLNENTASYFRPRQRFRFVFTCPRSIRFRMNTHFFDAEFSPVIVHTRVIRNIMVLFHVLGKQIGNLDPRALSPPQAREKTLGTRLANWCCLFRQ